MTSLTDCPKHGLNPERTLRMCVHCFGELETLVAERDKYLALVRTIDQALRVPAAEYVPAIQDVFKLIDRVAPPEDLK